MFSLHLPKLGHFSFNKVFLALFLLPLTFCFILFSSCTVGDFNDVYEVTIKYFYNTSTGSVESDNCTIIVPKNTYLQGNPVSWSEKRWKPNEKDIDLQYGYIGDGKIGIEGVRYRYTTDNNTWGFASYYNKDIKWDTGEVVDRDMFLTPLYVSDHDEEESITINFLYNKTDATSPDGYKVCLEPRTITRTEIENGTTLRKFQDGEYKIGLFDTQPDSEYVYGYMDAKDHNRLFLFESDSQQNNSFQYYYNGSVVDSDKKITFAMDNAVFSPVYVPMGYKNIPADESQPSGIYGVEQVYIPGNVIDGVFHPYPYTRAGSLQYGYDTSTSTRNDTPETSLSVPDMYVTSDFIQSGLLDHISSNYPELWAKYNITDNNMIINNGYLTKFSYRTGCVIANLLTEYYNLIHPDQEPLKPVYYLVKPNNNYVLINPNYSWPTQDVLRNSSSTVKLNVFLANTSFDANKTYFVADYNATGFRYPLHNEFEYMTRIVTDERQLPDLSDTLLCYIPCVPRNGQQSEYYYTVITPTASNNYANYFQSSAGTFNLEDINKVSYFGSGAGLAYYDKVSGKYNKTILRTFTDISGRRSNIEIPAVLSARNDSSGEENKNRMNGAGLWGMTACMQQYLSGFSTIGGIGYITLYNCTSYTSTEYGICGKLGITDTANTYLNQAGLRFCRTAYSNKNR